MKLKAFVLSAALAIASLISAPAFAQAPPYRPGLPPIDSNPPPTKLMCWDTGTATWLPCSIGSSSGSGGGAVTAAPNSYAAGFSPDIGTGSSPATTSMNGRLAALAALLAAPLTVNTHAVTQSGTWTVTVGSSALPSGAATSALQTTGNTSLTTLASAVAFLGSAGGGAGVQITARGSDGSARGFCVDGQGALCTVRAGVADRVITKASVTANTSTTICPATTLPVTTEIQVGGRTGLGMNGQSLTQVERGTATTTPDLMLPSADTLYTVPVAPTNAVTAYSATAFVAVCIQTVRQ